MHICVCIYVFCSAVARKLEGLNALTKVRYAYIYAYMYVNIERYRDMYIHICIYVYVYIFFVPLSRASWRVSAR